MSEYRTIGYPVKLTKANVHKYFDQVAKANELLRQAKEHRRILRENTWKENEKLYAGLNSIATDSDMPVVKKLGINLSFGIINTIVPYITGEHPFLLTLPMSRESTRTKALFHQAWLNTMSRSAKYGFAEPAYLSVWDSCVYGEGWLLANYDITTRPVRDKNGLPTGEEYVKVEQTADYVSPWDVFVDPLAHSKMRGRFIIRRILRTREEVENDESLRIPPGEDLIAYNPTTSEDRSGGIFNQQSSKAQVASTLDLVEIYDFYDLRKNTLITFSPGSSFPMRVVEDVVCPLTPVDGHRLPGTAYCASVLEMVASIANTIDEMATRIKDNADHTVKKLITRKGAWDPEAIAAMRSTIPGDNVELKVEEGVPLRDEVLPFELGSAPQDFYNLLALLPSMMEEVTGVTDYQKGRSDGIRHTATSATLLQNASDAKTAAWLRRIEEAFRRHFQLTLDQARDLYPLTDFDEMALWVPQIDAQRLVATAIAEGEEETILNYLGGSIDELDVSAVYGLKVGPSDDIFTGVYEVRIHPNSTELQNPALRAQKYHNVLMTIVELTASGMLDAPNVRIAADAWLRAEGIDNPEELLNLMPQTPLSGQVPAEDPAMLNAGVPLPAIPPEELEAFNPMEDPDLFLPT